MEDSYSEASTQADRSEQEEHFDHELKSENQAVKHSLFRRDGTARHPAKLASRSDESLEMATMKKPKKHFNTEQERDNFVRQYQMKKKTEMCRNWEISGTCKFKDHCSFAHGKHELVKKVHLPSNYKTKLCT